MSSSPPKDQPCSAIGVLLVDDEEGFRRSLAETLRDDGHPVLDYASPSHIPDLATLAGVRVLVTDYETPEMNGIRLADEFRARHPTAAVVVVTACRTRRLDGEAAHRRDFLQLVEKPLEYGALHALIHCAAR